MLFHKMDTEQAQAHYCCTHTHTHTHTTHTHTHTHTHTTHTHTHTHTHTQKETGDEYFAHATIIIYKVYICCVNVSLSFLL